VWVNTNLDTLKVEFDVRDLDHALSQHPKHCREPDAYGKWVWDEWETSSGKASYSIFLYAEGTDDIYVLIYCRGDIPGHRSVRFYWGDQRPKLSDDPFEVRRSDGTLHSSSHPVRVRYGDGVPRSESWQLISSGASSRNRSALGAYVGDGLSRIPKYRQVDVLTIWTDAESGETIRAEFDVRRLDEAFSRLDRECN